MTTPLPINQLQTLQFDDIHMTIILGLPAILLLWLGTILYQISKEKYTFAHGVCAGLSLLLTTINIVTILPLTNTVLSAGGVDIFHLIHIGLGVVGYLAGISAFLTGISGIRTKIPGLTAAVCWTIVFVMGYIQFLM
ncbi:hypothetical protein E4H12_09010 [Candidatus Thorarchaeota archaeon]|nr:MAG: hypothetical protein E4H12_09010 [Candidatus Thorarchaeota archaeon]